MSVREYYGDIAKEYDDRMACPRCSKERICCEMTQRDCEECGGEGGFEDDSDWQDGPDFPWRDCEGCDGQGWWWYCDCDDKGQHDATRRGGA